MIQMETVLKVADNTGAKKVKMIRALGHLKRTVGVGRKIVCHVVDASPEGIKKGAVVKAVIVRTKSPVYREDGSTLRFGENAVVIINDAGVPVGSRVFGPMPRELRDGDYTKLLSLAREVI